MATWLFIVARDAPDLYVHLREAFGAEADVEILMDRRLANHGARDGHRLEGAGSADGDRRRHRDVSEDLRIRGCAFVRVAD